MWLPEWYIEWVDRVSDIVSFVYPFKWESKKRYIEWVYNSIWDQVQYTWEYDTDKARKLVAEFPEFAEKYDVWRMIECEDEYIKEACDVWTYIHLQLEYYMLWNLDHIDDTKYVHNETLQYWYRYIDKLKEKYPNIKWLPEQVVRDKYNRYQWTIDLIRVDEETKTVWLYDWKTWWIAKHKYWLSNTYRKPYDKLKKLSLQLSLYAETYRQKWYKIWWIYWVWIHESETYEYNLELYSTEEINKILEEFIKRDELLPPNIDLIFKYNPMQIEINTVIPDQPYSNARVILETDDVGKFNTPQEAIDSAIVLQKYLISKY